MFYPPQFLWAGILSAQNQQNNLPASGNVGVDVMNLTSKLQVNGTVRIDSSMVVKDSAVFEKDVRVKNKLVVDKNVVMNQGKYIDYQNSSQLSLLNNLKVKPKWYDYWLPNITGFYNSYKYNH